METRSNLEINCPACETESLLVREPVYEGFQKVGEILKCANCGHVFAREDEVPFKAGEQVQVFDESDLPEKPQVFNEGEQGIVCRYCNHYVVNPFTQWCGFHRKEVEATDTCADFVAPEEEQEMEL